MFQFQADTRQSMNEVGNEEPLSMLEEPPCPGLGQRDAGKGASHPFSNSLCFLSPGCSMLGQSGPLLVTTSCLPKTAGIRGIQGRTVTW